MLPSPCPRLPSCCRSHLYEVDHLERQIRELELENRKLRRVQAGRIGGGPGAPFSPETSAAYTALEQGPHQRALAEEVARLRSENRSLEVEGIAFQQRMEAAINTFEEQLEQTAHDKELMSSELEEARKALADANAAKAAAEKVARQAQRQQAAGVAATDELQQQHSHELTELTRERDDAIASARMLRAEQLEARAAHERELRKLQDELRRNADVTTRSRDEIDEIRANERAAREAHEQLLREKEVVEQRLAECAVQLTRAEREREQALTQREQALASAAAQTERFAAAAQSAAARAQAQQEAKLAHARAEADEELVSVRAQTARAVAAAKAEAQAALAAADEELVSVRAQLEASRAAAKVATESAESAAAAQKSATAAEALTNGEAGRAKVEALSRMLREQQAELKASYGLCTTFRLGQAVAGVVLPRLSAAWAVWRANVSWLVAVEGLAHEDRSVRSEEQQQQQQQQLQLQQLQQQQLLLQQQHVRALSEMAKAKDGAIAEKLKVRADAMKARAEAERAKGQLREELRRATEAAERSREQLDEAMLLRRHEEKSRVSEQQAAALSQAEADETARAQTARAVAAAKAEAQAALAAADEELVSVRAQLEASRAAAKVAAESAESAAAAQTARAVAAAEAEAQAALAAADEELVSVRAQLEASRAAAKVAAESAESAGSAAAAQKSATAAEALTNGEAGRAKVEALSRMLQEQQAELTDGYRLSAYGKLAAAMDKRVVLSLATTLAQWRGKTDLISMGEEHTAALADLRSSSTVATGASVAALQIETTRLSSELSAATQAAMAQARGHRAQLEATEAALAVAKAEAHAAKVAADTGLAHMRSRLETVQTAVGATAAEALTNGEAGRAKVEALSRMLREQQAELTDGYRLFASIKVASAVEKRLVVSLATAWARWRLIHEFT